MPKKYESMKKKFISRGMSPKAAETKAAKIYNSQKKPGDAGLHTRKRRT